MARQAPEIISLLLLLRYDFNLSDGVVYFACYLLLSPVCVRRWLCVCVCIGDVGSAFGRKIQPGSGRID